MNVKKSQDLMTELTRDLGMAPVWFGLATGALALGLLGLAAVVVWFLAGAVLDALSWVALAAVGVVVVWGIAATVRGRT